MKKYLFIALIGFLASSIQVIGQGNYSLYQLNTTAQSHYVNPAYKPNAKFYISLPLGMQSVSVFHNGFTFNNLVQKRQQDDSLEVRPSEAIAKMAAVNRLGFDVQNELLGFGFRIKKSYFSFNITNHTQLAFSYPRDLFKFAVEGNGKELIGQRASLDGLGLNMNAYIEYGLGFNREFGEKLSLGARVKFLSGIANVHTKKSQLGIYTDPNTFDLTIDGSMEVNTSNVRPFFDTTSNVDQSFIVPYLANFKNGGFGIDLGASYKLTDKITLSASAIDLGFIRWKENTSNYVSSDVNFTFRGVDLKEFFQDTSDFVSNFTDSLKEIFSYSDNTNKYKTSLTSRLYIGGTYELTKNFSTSVLLFSQVSQSKYRGGLSIAANAKFGEWFTATINYSAYGRSLNNIGLGFSLRGGPIQFYCMTDNVLAFTSPQTAKNVNVTFGMGLVFGKPDKKDKAARRLNETIDKQVKTNKKQKEK